jgi:DnaD/phage-associated family protein
MITAEQQETPQNTASFSFSFSPSPSPSISSCSYSEEEIPNVFKTYEQEFGIIGSMTGDILTDLEQTYGAEWVVRAMKQAVIQNVRKISYVESTLKNWKATGLTDPWISERKGGHSNAKHQGSTQGIQHGRDSPQSQNQSITGGQVGWLPSSKQKHPL